MNAGLITSNSILTVTGDATVVGPSAVSALAPKCIPCITYLCDSPHLLAWTLHLIPLQMNGGLAVASSTLAAHDALYGAYGTGTGTANLLLLQQDINTILSV